MIEIHHSWGHPGIDKTLELMTRNYWWPGMKKDIQKYITGCNTCQTVKPDRQAKAAPLHLNKIPEGPWQIISVDMMGPLPESKGFDTILVVVDRFTKKIILPSNQLNDYIQRNRNTISRQSFLRTQIAEEGH